MDEGSVLGQGINIILGSTGEGCAYRFVFAHRTSSFYQAFNLVVLQA
jgi:hypothetical protein